MQTGKGLAFLSLSLASGMALAVPAAANAAPVASGKYNSTASATAGGVALGNGPAAQGNKVTATDSNPSPGMATGVSSGDLPNGLGTIAATNGADLLTTHAQASAAGTSSACSAIAAGACGRQSQPLAVSLSLKRILQVAQSGGGGSLPIGSVGSVLPGNLDNYSIVLGLTGPAVACTAGPAGGPGSAFTVSRTIGSGTVDLQNGSQSVIGGPKTIGTNGDALAPLSSVLKSIPGNAVSLSATAGSDSGAGAGPETAAQGGKLSVSVNGVPVVTLTGGSVSCGPNQQAPSTATSSSTPVPPGNSGGSGGLASGSPGGTGFPSTSSEKPLTSIKTDEGRYVPASNSIPLWADLAAAGVALAGGVALWRRRRLSRS